MTYRIVLVLLAVSFVAQSQETGVTENEVRGMEEELLRMKGRELLKTTSVTDNEGRGISQKIPHHPSKSYYPRKRRWKNFKPTSPPTFAPSPIVTKDCAMPGPGAHGCNITNSQRPVSGTVQFTNLTFGRMYFLNVEASGDLAGGGEFVDVFANITNKIRTCTGLDECSPTNQACVPTADIDVGAYVTAEGVLDLTYQAAPGVSVTHCSRGLTMSFILQEGRAAPVEIDSIGRKGAVQFKGLSRGRQYFLIVQAKGDLEGSSNYVIVSNKWMEFIQLCNSDSQGCAGGGSADFCVASGLSVNVTSFVTKRGKMDFKYQASNDVNENICPVEMKFILISSPIFVHNFLNN